jgi:hypothetical protein
MSGDEHDEEYGASFGVGRATTAARLAAPVLAAPTASRAVASVKPAVVAPLVPFALAPVASTSRVSAASKAAVNPLALQFALAPPAASTYSPSIVAPNALNPNNQLLGNQSLVSAAPAPSTNPYIVTAPPANQPAAVAASSSPASSGGGGSSGGGSSGGGGSSDSAAQNDPEPAAQQDMTPWTPTPAAAAAPVPGAPTTALPVTSTALAVVPSAALATVPAATTAPAVATPSLWSRFWSWLGFGAKPATPAATTATPVATAHGDPSLAQIAESLVRRARAGDQNAMGMIQRVAENAKAGSVKAKPAAAAIYAYIQANPMTSTTMGSDEPNDPTFCEAVKLSRGVTLYDNRIHGFMTSHFGAEEERGAFAYGVRNPHEPYPLRLPSTLDRAHRMGRTVGLARKLQAVRLPSSPISQYNARVGYELGEAGYGAELDRVSQRG